MRIKKIFRFDPSQKKLRLFRLIWERGIVGDGRGYSAFLSFALLPAIYRFEREAAEWRVCFAGVSIHHQKSYGGRHA